MVRGFIAIAIAMVLCVCLGVVGWLSIHNVSTTPVLYFFATGVGPTIGLLWNNFKTGKVADNLEDVKGEVQQITHQTNGVLTERIQKAVSSAIAEQQNTMAEAVKEAWKDMQKDDTGGK